MNPRSGVISSRNMAGQWRTEIDHVQEKSIDVSQDQICDKQQVACIMSSASHIENRHLS